MPAGTQPDSERRAQLRERAEKQLQERAASLSTQLPPDVRGLLHELQVHQIELQMQNEELQEAYAELSDARDRLGDLYHLAPVGYVTIGPEGTILRTNYTFIGMLRTELSLVGTPFARFVHPDDADLFYFHQRDAFRESVIHSIELRLRRTNGVIFHARLDTVSGGTPEEPYARVAITDITERVEAEHLAAKIAREAQRSLEAQVADRTAELAAALERERQARAQAEEANGFKTRLLGMISHELRTPLTSILGFASSLLAEDVRWDTNSEHDFLQTIVDESEKLKELVDQLLQASRLEAGGLSVEPEPVSVPAIVAVAVPQLEMLTSKHELVVEVPDDLPVVMADVRRIAQVLANLVKNATQHSPPGSAIQIVARPERSTVRIDVVDHGTGIPPDARGYIFEAFRRPENDERIGGAGLGLAICKGLVDAHGGRIWITDTHPQGTTVSFTLHHAG